MKKFSRPALLIGAALSISALALPQLDTLLKGAGIYVVIQKVGPEINKALNSLTKHSDTPTDATKVVPIISFGSGTAAGAAQVKGAKTQVDKVVSVLQIEGKALGSVRIKALIPISSKSAKDTKPVDGVGVSGLIDIKI